jgi:hypothetical protein
LGGTGKGHKTKAVDSVGRGNNDCIPIYVEARKTVMDRHGKRSAYLYVGKVNGKMQGVGQLKPRLVFNGNLLFNEKDDTAFTAIFNRIEH